MNLAATVEIYAGGPGSGCNPEKGKCGRPRSRFEREAQKGGPDIVREFRQLRQRLLSIGGKDLVYSRMDAGDPYFESGQIFKEGQLWKGSKVTMQTGLPSSCHDNVCGLVKKGAIPVTGFALGDDGLWRRHSWGLKGGRLIETTVRSVAYFGVPLRGKEAKKFLKVTWGEP